MSKGRAAMFDHVINALPEGVCIQYKYEPHVSYRNHFHSAMSKALALVLVSLFLFFIYITMIMIWCQLMILKYKMQWRDFFLVLIVLEKQLHFDHLYNVVVFFKINQSTSFKFNVLLNWCFNCWGNLVNIHVYIRVRIHVSTSKQS